MWDDCGLPIVVTPKRFPKDVPRLRATDHWVFEIGKGRILGGLEKDVVVAADFTVAWFEGSQERVYVSDVLNVVLVRYCCYLGAPTDIQRKGQTSEWVNLSYIAQERSLFWATCLGWVPDAQDATIRCLVWERPSAFLCGREMWGKTSKFKDASLLTVLQDVAYGLDELHNNGFFFRFLNWNHVWVFEDLTTGELRGKLYGCRTLVMCAVGAPMDKGVAIDDTNEETPYFFISPNVMAPPYVHTAADDIYSFGCLMWYVLTRGCYPWKDAGMSIPNAIYCVATQKMGLCERFPHLVDKMLTDGNVPAGVIQLMRECLAVDPTKRPETMEGVARRLGAFTKN